MRPSTSGLQPDRGYAWVVLGMAVLAGILVSDYYSTAGVFYTEYTRHRRPDAPRAAVAVVAGVKSLMTIVGAVVSLVAVPRVGARRIILACTALTVTGYLTTMWVANIYALIFSHGVLPGLGLGVSSALWVQIVATFFDRYRALAFGVMYSAHAVGSTMWPSLLQYLFSQYSWAGAFLINGGIHLNMLVVAFVVPKDFGLKQVSASKETTVLGDVNGVQTSPERHIDDDREMLSEADKLFCSDDVNDNHKEKVPTGCERDLEEQGQEKGKNCVIEHKQDLCDLTIFMEGVNNSTPYDKIQKLESSAQQLNRTNFNAPVCREYTTDSSEYQNGYTVLHEGNKPTNPTNRKYNKDSLQQQCNGIPEADTVTRQDPANNAKIPVCTIVTTVSPTTNSASRDSPVVIEEASAVPLRSLLNRRVLVCLGALVLTNYGHATPYAFLPARALETPGLTATHAAAMVSLMGGINIVCRPLMGWLADRLRPLHRPLVYAGAVAGYGASTLLLAAVTSWQLMVVNVLAMGLFASFVVTVMAPVVTDTAGGGAGAARLLPPAVSVGMFSGAITGGVIIEVTGSINNVMLVAGSSLLLSAAIITVNHLV